jgi:type IV secretion system protein TrbI
VIGDPYEEADQQDREDAKIVPPTTVKKSRKLVVAGLVLTGVIVLIVIVSHVAGMLGGGGGQSSQPVPTTMTKPQSDEFRRQQSGQADYMKSKDHGKDVVMGDDFAEAEGVPKKTQAQDDAERGKPAPVKSDAQIAREKAAAELARRREKDLDASPMSVDFSSYFDKGKTAAAGVAADAEVEGPPVRRSSAFHDVLANPEEGERTAAEKSIASSRQAHDPKEDYEFDSATGKLYRLMEDTILETVLVNRITGAAPGPIIVMVTTDVYSKSRLHLLIPQGTRILGRVSAVGSTAQERLFVGFHRMITPDGYSVSLDKFQGLDVVGQTGLKDLVNYHYVQIFGASIALAAVAAVAQVGNSGGSLGGYDWGVSMRNGVTQGLGQSAQRVMERFLNVLPTFTIRERAHVKIMLSGDMLLPDVNNHTMDPDL